MAARTVIDLSFSLKIDVTDKQWLDFRTLYSLESVLLLNASHPLANREGLSLADFRDETSSTSPPGNHRYSMRC
jgi:DNA-binding transcriptional LysR family regulator